MHRCVGICFLQCSLAQGHVIHGCILYYVPSHPLIALTSILSLRLPRFVCDDGACEMATATTTRQRHIFIVSNLRVDCREHRTSYGSKMFGANKSFFHRLNSERSNDAKESTMHLRACVCVLCAQLHMEEQLNRKS